MACRIGGETVQQQVLGETVQQEVVAYELMSYSRALVKCLL